MKEESTRTDHRAKIGKKILISSKRTGKTQTFVLESIACERTRKTTPKQKKKHQKSHSDEEVMTILRFHHLSVPFRK